MAYLKSLNAEDCDDLLETIVYTSVPEKFGGRGSWSQIWLHTSEGGGFNVNYSQIFTSLGNKIQIPSDEINAEAANERLPSPEVLRTGDWIQFGNNRGAGSYYVIWLKKGLVTHDAAFLDSLKSVLEVWDGEIDDDVEKNSKPAKKAKTTKKSKNKNPISYASRSEDGPHNDGNHDCYLIAHSDEYGYVASTIFSSLPPNYFTHLDKAVFDPIITHSQSHFGKLITTHKEEEEWAEDEDFPFEFYGHMDDKSGDDVDWIDIDREDGMTKAMRAARQLLNDHFVPDGWEPEEESEGEEGSGKTR